jgi:hypothetical protein
MDLGVFDPGFSGPTPETLLAGAGERFLIKRAQNRF